MTFALSLADASFMAADPHSAYEIGIGDFTVEAWVRTATAGGTGTVIGRKGPGTGPAQGGFLLVVQAEGYIRFTTDSGATLSEVVTSARTVVNDGYWHHLAAVRRAATMEIYLDGAAQPLTARLAPAPVDVSNGRRLTVGGVEQTREQFRFLTGTVGAVAFWSAARTAAQVAAGMRAVPDRAEPSLLGYWGFDRGDGADRSRNGNPMLPSSGAARFVTPGAPVAKGDFAAVLASGGYLAAPPRQDYALFAQDFTVAAWIRTAVPGGSGTIVGYIGDTFGSPMDGYVLVVRPDGTIKWQVGEGGLFSQQLNTRPTPVNDANWHHVAATRQGTNLVIVLDGQPVLGSLTGQAPRPAQITTVRRLTIGTTDAQQEQYRSFTGAIDEVTLWRVARSPMDVATDMRTDPGPEDNRLLGYWPFSYQSGHDLSGRGNPAVVNGAVTFQTPGPRGDTVLSLSGGGRLLAPPHVMYRVGTGDFTAEMWIRTAAAGGAGTVISHEGPGSGPGQGGFRLTVGPDGAVSLLTDDGSATWTASTATAARSDVTVNDGYWHHLAGIRRAGTLEIHIDGRSMPVTVGGSGSTPLDINAEHQLIIGAGAPGQEPNPTFTGTIAAVALWRTARPAADLTPLSGDEPGLVGYWDFGLRDGFDRSPTRNRMVAAGPIAYTSPAPPYGQVVADVPVLTRLDCAADVLRAEWQPVRSPLVTGYSVEILDDQDRQVALAQVGGVAADVPVSLDPAGHYRARVRAVSRQASGRWSAAAPLVTAMAMITRVECDGTEVVVDHTGIPPGAATTLVAEVSVDGKPIATASVASGRVWLRPSLTAGQEARVRLRGVTGIASGPWSEAVPVITAVARELLVAGDGNRIVVMWQSVPAAVRYIVRLTSDGTPREIVEVAETAVVLSTTLTGGVAYEARVRASTGVSLGPWSPPAAGQYARHQTITRDGLGRIRQVSDERTRTDYEYDALGNVTSITTNPITTNPAT